MNRSRKAFTLIELLVVIAVIAILMSILVPALSAAREQAKRAQCGANQRGVGTGMLMYAADNDDKIPPALFGDTATSDTTWTYIAYRIDKSKPWGQHITSGPHNLGFLYDAKLVQDARALYCNSVPLQPEGDTPPERVSYHYDMYHDDAHPWPWNIQTEYHEYLVRAGFNYIPQAHDGKDSMGFASIATSASQLWEGAVTCTDQLKGLETLPHTGSGEKGRGLNVLFGDASVKWVTNPDAFAPHLWNPKPNNSPRNFRLILEELE